MENFEFYNSTKIIFGRETIHNVGAEIKAHNGANVMILYSGTYLEENGILEAVQTSLKKAGLHFISQGDIQPNPLLSSIEKLSALAQKEDIDFFLAIGGGSVIDSAKALAIMGADQRIDMKQVVLGKQEISSCLPVGVISTIAGSGSEASCSLVLTIDENMLKRSYDHDMIRPLFAIMDPTLTFTLPSYQMVSGGCDILMHTMERYFSPSEHTTLIDRISEGLMRVVIDSIRKSIQNPNDYEARANLMWAGSLSHNGLTGTGRIEDWATHRLEHEISGMFNAIHGAGLCAIWCSWAYYVYQDNIKRFCDYARNVWNIDCLDDAECARKGIQATSAFFQEVGMPSNLRELGCKNIKDEDIEKMADNCLLTTSTIGQLKQLNRADIITIYKNARGDI